MVPEAAMPDPKAKPAVPFSKSAIQSSSALRVGLPVRLTSPLGDVLAAPAEGISAERLGALRAVGEPVLAITAWRARTLKARAYDGDVARLRVPADASSAWVSCVADPADDRAERSSQEKLVCEDSKATIAMNIVKDTKDSERIA